MTDNISQPAAANEMTLGQLIQDLGVKPGTVRMAFPSMGLSNFDRSRAVTPNEVAVITERYGDKKKVSTTAKNKPKATPAVTITMPVEQPAVIKPQFKIDVTLPDMIIWGEIGLGWYSLFNLAGISGLGFGAVATIFYEFSRQVIRRTYKEVPQPWTMASDIAQAYNDNLRELKKICFGISMLIACVFCFSNWQSFYNSIALATDLEKTILFGAAFSIAHLMATVFAVLLSAIAYLCLRAISIYKQITE
jgi:hypothetical protein